MVLHWFIILRKAPDWATSNILWRRIAWIHICRYLELKLLHLRLGLFQPFLLLPIHCIHLFLLRFYSGPRRRLYLCTLHLWIKRLNLRNVSVLKVSSSCHHMWIHCTVWSLEMYLFWLRWFSSMLVMHDAHGHWHRSWIYETATYWHFGLNLKLLSILYLKLSMIKLWLSPIRWISTAISIVRRVSLLLLLIVIHKFYLIINFS